MDDDAALMKRAKDELAVIDMDEESDSSGETSEEVEVIDEEEVDTSAWTSFPMKVYKMIMSETAANPSVIRWVENGGAFYVDGKNPMLPSIVEKYFPDFDYPAFERRLKKFGWICQGGTCHHPNFHRDQTASISSIDRTSSMATKSPQAQQQQIRRRAVAAPEKVDNEGSRNRPIPIIDLLESESDSDDVDSDADDSEIARGRNGQNKTHSQHKTSTGTHISPRSSTELSASTGTATKLKSENIRTNSAVARTTAIATAGVKRTFSQTQRKMPEFKKQIQPTTKETPILLDSDDSSVEVNVNDEASESAEQPSVVEVDESMVRPNERIYNGEDDGDDDVDEDDDDDDGDDGDKNEEDKSSKNKIRTNDKSNDNQHINGIENNDFDDDKNNDGDDDDDNDEKDVDDDKNCYSVIEMDSCNVTKSRPDAAIPVRSVARRPSSLDNTVETTGTEAATFTRNHILQQSTGSPKENSDASLERKPAGHVKAQSASTTNFIATTENCVVGDNIAVNDTYPCYGEDQSSAQVTKSPPSTLPADSDERMSFRGDGDDDHDGHGESDITDGSIGENSSGMHASSSANNKLQTPPDAAQTEAYTDNGKKRHQPIVALDNIKVLHDGQHQMVCMQEQNNSPIQSEMAAVHTAATGSPRDKGEETNPASLARVAIACGDNLAQDTDSKNIHQQCPKKKSVSTKSIPKASTTLANRRKRHSLLKQQSWQKLHWKQKKRIMKDLIRDIASKVSRQREQHEYDTLQHLLSEKRDKVLLANRPRRRPLICRHSNDIIEETFARNNKKIKCENGKGVMLDLIEPPTEPFTSCIFVKKAYHAQDMKELTYVPYFDDDDDNDILSDDLFDTEARERQLERGPVYQQELTAEAIDEVIRQALPTIMEQCNGGFQQQENELTKLMEIIAEVLAVDVEWVFERHRELLSKEEAKAKGTVSESQKIKAETDDERYLGGVDSFRSLFCRQCFTYDCNLHGNLQKPNLQLQYELGLQKLRDGRFEHEEGIPIASKLKKVLPHEYPLEPVKELTDFHKAICQRLFLAFDGNIDRIASTMCAPQRLVAEFVNLKQFKLPRLGQKLKTAGVKITNSRSMRHYNQAWLRRIEMAEIHPFFTPCTHDEPCSEKTCWCIQNAFFCTPACAWGYRSPNYFRGCNCKGACNTNSCMCYAARRECDPDLCKQCGSCTDAPDKPATKQRCRNDSVSMRRHCALLVGKSGIAGWGLYTKYTLRKGDYIHEYVGELISQDEAERRGRIYDKQNRSYLFNLSSDFALDATRKGNKTRFINHSDTPNCIPKIFFVKGIYRIGIFAKEDIEPQTELFFDYGYNNSMNNHLINKPGTTVDWMIDPSMASKISKGK